MPELDVVYRCPCVVIGEIRCCVLDMDALPSESYSVINITIQWRGEQGYRSMIPAVESTPRGSPKAMIHHKSIIAIPCSSRLLVHVVPRSGQIVVLVATLTRTTPAITAAMVVV